MAHFFRYAVWNLLLGMPSDGKTAFGAAFLAGADLPQKIIGVDAGVVTIRPVDMDRIIAHDVYPFGLYILRDEVRLDETLVRPFVHASGTPAGHPQIARLIEALMGVAPLDANSTLR